jgi:hypothetical protein
VVRPPPQRLSAVPRSADRRIHNLRVPVTGVLRLRLLGDPSKVPPTT